MRRLVWAKAFRRAFKKAVQQKPDQQAKIEKALRLLADDPFDPALQSHKLKGKLQGLWACKVDFDSRILFMLLSNQDTGEEEILLVSIGTHREVY
ncbi:MAG: type II toxin-antitoxin system mRNA interferase toxin, RelE/StbE family [Methanothrix sp.]|nr:type II toxin-antitoxin system mRNA interferase toxin, RelE/StbE family [Methanothrix sp.]